MNMKKPELIEESRKILEDYEGKITLRQLYYRLVAKHYIENTINSYKRLSRILVEARLTGQIPFNAFEDRTRSAEGRDMSFFTPQYFFSYYKDEYENAENTFRNAPQSYNLPLWFGQENYVEVWLEKQALQNVFKEITDKYGITLAVCRGYPSTTFLYEAKERILDNREDEEGEDRNIVILYFGDYDPTGEDIPRHISYSLVSDFGVDISDFEKVALTIEQIEELNLPPEPTKKTDSRSRKFIEEHGDMAVELDAVEPRTLMSMIESAILRFFDRDAYEERNRIQEENRAMIEDWIRDYFGE